jgi:hypothetical protein
MLQRGQATGLQAGEGELGSKLQHAPHIIFAVLEHGADAALLQQIRTRGAGLG